MRIFLAALFVYVGLMNIVIFLADQDWFENTSPFIIVPITIVVISGLLFAANRLFNKNKSIQIYYEDKNTKLDRNKIWSFKFTNSVQDLLIAESAERQESTGMRKFYRSLVILMGVLWIFFPIMNINNISSTWQPVISELLGLFTLQTQTSLLT